MSGILIGELDELRRRAALRHCELYGGSELAKRIEISRREREHDPLGALLERQIIAHDERPQDCAFRRVLDVFQEAMLARYQPALANPQDDAGRVIAVACQR